MGQGSGATAATYLSSTQLSSREMVSGIVAMSGTPYAPSATDDTPKQMVKEVATINKCQRENKTEIIRCMRAVS